MLENNSLLIIFITGLIFSLLSTFIFEELTFGNKIWCAPSGFFGFKIHHSFFGLLLIILGLVLFKYKPKVGVFLISFGLGMIIIHTIYDGRFIFIERLNSYIKYIKDVNLNC